MYSRCAQAPGQLDLKQRWFLKSRGFMQLSESILSNTVMRVCSSSLLLQDRSTVALVTTLVTSACIQWKNSGLARLSMRLQFTITYLLQFQLRGLVSPVSC